jgi:hypothetical protein
MSRLAPMMPVPTHTERRLQAGEVVHGDLASLDAVNCEAVGVFCWSDVKPLAGAPGFLDWRLCGALSRTLENTFFTARRSEVMLLAAKGRGQLHRIFAFGLGPMGEANATGLRHVCRQAYEAMVQAGVKRFVFAAPGARRRPDLEAAFLKALREELPGRIDVILVEHAA